MSESRINVGQLARNIARNLRDRAADLVEGGPAPVVILDAIAEPTDQPVDADQIDPAAPVVVVGGTQDSGFVHNDMSYTVQLLVAIDTTAQAGGANAVRSQDHGDGILVAGNPIALESVVDAVTDALRDMRPGAVLQRITRQWHFEALPVQWAGIQAEYSAFVTFDDDYDTF